MSIEDKSTRGKTKPGRLRMVDTWLAASIEAGFTPTRCADVGPGEHAWTALELHATLTTHVPGSSLVVVENDPDRCANLVAEASGAFDVRHSGLDLDGLDSFDFIRCMNVFRQYPVEDATAGYRQLRSRLAPGGKLVCGTTDSYGSIGSFWVWSSTGDPELIVFTTGERGFAPRQFRDFLPRDIRRNPADSNPFLEFLPVWERAWGEVRQGIEPLEAFDRSVSMLERRGLARLIQSGIGSLRLYEPK